MIKIKSWFSEDARNNYLNEILGLLKKSGTDEIEFLPNQKIDLKTLLTGTREEVFKVPGIRNYMDICRCHIKKSNYTQADFLTQLNIAFPQTVVCESKSNELIYKMSQHSVSVNNKKTEKRTISGDILPFFKFYLHTIGVSTKKANGKYKFKDFVTDALNGLEKIHKKANLIKYSLTEGTLRNQILASLDIKCCPYCNRQYITVWREESGTEHATADLDHFYQKAEYPLFALSLFNFVPSCQICNSRMKGSKEIETLYPYTEGMDLFRFQCKPQNGQPDSLVDLWLGYKLNEPNKLLELYKLGFVDESDPNISDDIGAHVERIHGSIEMFRLEEVYQTHLETAINVMLKTRIYYSDYYKKYAENTLRDLGLDPNAEWNGFSAEEMRDIILGFVYDGQDRMDQPLGKLLNDILEHELQIKQLCNTVPSNK